MEDPQQKIRDEIKGILSEFIGENAFRNKAHIAAAVDGVFRKSLPLQPSNTEVKILWETMSIKDKVKWFLFNKGPLRSEADWARKTYDSKRSLFYELHPDGYFNEDLPSYFQPTPRGVVLVKSCLQLYTPMECINVEIKI